MSQTVTTPAGAHGAHDRFSPARHVHGERDPACATLRERLDDFYATTEVYQDFQKESWKPGFWTPIADRIEGVVSDAGSCSVLEFGAGRTGFPRFLRERGVEGVRVEVQDITDQNREHLASTADAVHIGDLSSVEGAYDVIFSTFVWEHVSHPERTLGVLLKLLKPGGSLFIASPRYDAVGYTPASAKHYGVLDRLRLHWWLWRRRARTRRERRPAFLIHSDPALFSRDWFIDADAVHWVSRDDLTHALPAGYSVRSVEPEGRARGVKGRLYRRFMLMFVEVRAPES